MRTAVLIPLCLLSLVTVSPVRAQSDNLTPLKERVNVQADSARTNQIIDGRWVAVGTNKPHTIQLDYSRPFQGKPSYRFELKQEDKAMPREKPKVVPNCVIVMLLPMISVTIRQLNTLMRRK